VQKKTGAKAQAREIDGEFVVLKGSCAVPAWKQKTTNGQGDAKLHKQLLDSGVIQPEKPTGKEAGWAEFTKEQGFSSPSAASAVILARSDNGRTSWKVEDTQKTYAAWQDEEVQAADTSEPAERDGP
jgi:hypothetical protein